MNVDVAARQQLRRKRWLRALGVLACVVVFCTVYALVLPAITMEGTPNCGLEEHTHTDACYDVQLTCTSTDPDHEHTDACYTRTVICGMAEHVHGDACYAEAEEDDVQLAEKAEPEASAEPDTEDAAVPEGEAKPEVSAEPEESAEPEDKNNGFVMMAAPPARLLGDDSGSSIMDGRTVTGANDWQIVSGGYEGNEDTNKVTYSADGNVRVQKNVIPTDTENEFLVYLSVDYMESLAESLQYATYYAFTNNSAASKYVPGDIAPKGEYTESDIVILDRTGLYSKKAYFDIYDSETGTYLAKDVLISWDHGNNVTFGLKLKDGSFFFVGVSVKDGAHPTLVMGPELKEVIKEQIVAGASLKSVTDVMGDYITYVDGSAIGDFESAPSYSTSGKTLNWVIRQKTNAETKDEVIEVDGVTTTTTWHLNVAELLYRVKLDVTKEGFQSCAETIDDKSASPAYAVNNSAVLTYDDDNKTVAFPVPTVRGLLYTLQGFKFDKEYGTGLGGATFTISRNGETLKDADGNDIIATSDDQGNFLFSKGMEFGTYTVQEKTAPAGYELNTEAYEVTIPSYTENKDATVTSGDYRLYNAGADALKIPDQLKRVEIQLIKKDEGESFLAGAHFTIQMTDKKLDSTVFEDVNAVSGDDGVIATLTKVADGDYLITETAAPAGYVAADPITIHVDNTTVELVSGSAVLEVASRDSDGLPTAYTLTIHNNYGRELPATGGAGTSLYYICGLALLSGAAMMFMIRRRQHAA